MFVYLRSQGLLQGLTKANVVNDQGHEIITTLQPGATNATKLAAYKTDMTISQIITSTLVGEAYDFNAQKFPITKDTRDDDFLGLKLWLGLTEKFNCPLIRSEIFKKKMEILCLHFNGVGNYIKAVQTMRHELVANAKFNDAQVTLLDEDIIQSMLSKLPNHYNAFVLAMRTINAYTMTVGQLVEKILLAEREMMTSHPKHHRHLPPHQEEVSSMKTGEKWKKKKKEKKGKGNSVEGSIIDSSKLFNPNLNSIKKISNYLFSPKSHKINFMLDSGATSHFINDRAMLTNFIEDKISINLADNSKTNSEGYGMVLWKTVDKNTGKDITIKLKKFTLYPTYIKIYYHYQRYLFNSLQHQKSTVIRKT